MADTVTREEVEQATEALTEHPLDIASMYDATANTFILEIMIAVAGSVSPAVSIRAAYHHGIRVGLRIAAMRAERDKQRNVQ